MAQTAVIRRQQLGNNLKYTPASTAVTAGDVIVIGTIPFVADVDIAVGRQGDISCAGVFDVPKDGSTFADGDPVYWNATGNPNGGTAGTGACTSTASGNNLMGFIVPGGGDAVGSAKTVGVKFTADKRTTSLAGAVVADSVTGDASTMPLAGLAAAQGGSISMTGGASSTSANAGGAASVTGGAPGATGIGGAVTIAGAAGGATSGAGGACSMTGGAGTAGNAAGGASSIAGGAGQGSANGGAASVTGGQAGATGTGGACTLAGGVGGATSGAGGNMSCLGGAGTLNAAGGTYTGGGGAGQGTGAGGAATCKGGASGAGATGNGGAYTAGGGAALSTNGTGGAATVAGGVATGTGTGGALTLAGGASGGASGTAGAASLDAGAATGGTGATVNIGDTNATAVYLARGPLKSVVFGSTTAALGTTQNSTPTAAQLLGGIVTQTGQTGAGTVTTPTGTVLSAAMPRTPVVGDTFECLFANLGGGQTLTITAGASGMTVIGTAAVASGKTALLCFVNTGANTWNCYCVVSA